MAEHDLALQLGSCQVQAIANDKFLDVAQRKLTMDVIYGTVVAGAVPGGKGAAPTRRSLENTQHDLCIPFEDTLCHMSF